MIPAYSVVLETCVLGDGFMDSWLYGFMGLWIHGFMDSWLYGFMALWIYGFMDSLLYGFMALWIYGSMDSWLYGFMVLFYVRFPESRNPIDDEFHHAPTDDQQEGIVTSEATE